MRNLPGVDAQLAAKSELACAARVGKQQIRVFPRRARPIDRGLDACEPGGEHKARAECQQLIAIAVDAEFELEIDGAEHQALHAWRSRNGLGPGHAHCSLDQRIKRQTFPAA